MEDPLLEEVVAKLEAALFAGRKIEAIKVYREATGVCLAKAKRDVETMEARLRQSMPEQFQVPPGGSGCALAAVFLGLAMSLLAYGAWRELWR